MNNDSDRIEVLVSEGRVKLHLFEPSNRTIWTVVGKGEEHWVDPVSQYCSCLGFYFSTLNDSSSSCYHLKSVSLAQKENNIEQIVFSDDEFSSFLSGLIDSL